MVKVLCYKSVGRWFDPSWCQWIFHWHKIRPIALWPWGRLSLQQKWVPGVFPAGKGGQCIRLTTYHHPVLLSWTLGSLTSWNPLGLTRLVMGLIYLFTQKIIQKNKLIKRILAFSAKKIKANPPPPSSTLNPETSSDSPSAKSKGVRLVSAKQEMNQINDKGRERKINHK